MSPRFVEQLVSIIKGVSDRTNARVDALERRLDEHEAKPHIKYVGTWKSGQTYQPGDAATHHGALWLCKATTAGEPSKDFAGWQLAVKKGGA